MIKRCFFITAIIIIGFIFWQNSKQIKSQTFYAMGTNLTITIAEKNFDQNIFNLAFKEFKRVESLFKKEPNLNNKEVNSVYLKAIELQKQTNGVFSPYLSDVIALWQFDKTNKTINKAPKQQQIKQALKSKKINLYAIAKGYGIDQVAMLLQKNNINNFIVEAGGDLFVSGKKYDNNWQIGLKNSNHILSCDNNFAIATSSNLYNAYIFNGKKYGHLINGNTGWPSQSEKTISVISTNATTSDGLSTAVFVDESIINKQNISTIKQDAKNFSTFNITKNCKVTKIGL